MTAVKKSIFISIVGLAFLLAGVYALCAPIEDIESIKASLGVGCEDGVCIVVDPSAKDSCKAGETVTWDNGMDGSAKVTCEAMLDEDISSDSNSPISHNSLIDPPPPIQGEAIFVCRLRGAAPKPGTTPTCYEVCNAKGDSTPWPNPMWEVQPPEGSPELCRSMEGSNLPVGSEITLRDLDFGTVNEPSSLGEATVVCREIRDAESGELELRIVPVEGTDVFCHKSCSTKEFTAEWSKNGNDYRGEANSEELVIHGGSTFLTYTAYSDPDVSAVFSFTCSDGELTAMQQL